MPFDSRPRLTRPTMARTSPIKFLQEVRAEGQKVTWPTRRETMITSSMVFIFVVIAALFFLVADKIIGFVVKALLGV